MEPASKIIEKLGGEAVVARITGTASTAPYRWQYPVDRGGTGGSIPQKHIEPLIAFAREHGIDLKTDDFFPSVAEPERAAS